ncbi:MAG: hypothetical protein ACHP9W_05565 [Steroidobacterales bacterium]
MLLPALLALGTAGCARAPSARAMPGLTTAQTTPGAQRTAAGGCLASHDGYLRVRLRGAQNLDIDWPDRALQCDGGPRPNRAGMRLTFAGPGPRAGLRLRFVFGIAGVHGVGYSQSLPANATVLYEGDSRIYSTRGDDKCTIDELSRTPLGTSPAEHALRVSGRGFCVAPAAAIDGGEGLLLSRFDFAGLVIDDESESEAAPATAAR